MGTNIAAVVFFVTLLGSGCGQFESGNRDRENCSKVAAGMSANDAIERMGKPRKVRHREGEEIWAYGRPSMPGLPMFAADKPIELVFVQSPAGAVLKEARCSAVDG